MISERQRQADERHAGRGLVGVLPRERPAGAGIEDGGRGRPRTRTPARPPPWPRPTRRTRSSRPRTAQSFELGHGAVVIAAITSCTNTSNPSVMLGAGLLAKKAVERGLAQKPWVKTSLAPGSKVVTEYLERSGLDKPLVELGFDLVGYGCTTCIGNSGPLPEAISEAIEESNLVVCSVLSGNRNFEGRIHPEVKMNYLASPPLCVAYALAGPDGHRHRERPDRPGLGRRGRLPARHLAVAGGGQRRRRVGRRVGDVPEQLRRHAVRGRRQLEGDRHPRGRPLRVAGRLDLRAARAVLRGHVAGAARGLRAGRGRARSCACSATRVTTDHISPAGAFKEDTPAGRVPARARRRAQGLQLVRLTARQPRGDDARHVRERAAAEPARARAPRAASRSTSRTRRR